MHAQGCAFEQARCHRRRLSGPFLLLALVLALVSVAAVAGCGGKARGPPDVQGGGAGTRLAIDVLKGPDGLEQFYGFHDTARDEDCTFRVASDGVWRCLPASPLNHYFSEGVSYSDAACSPGSRVVVVNSFGPGVALLQDQATCPTRYRVHEPGTFLSPGAERWGRSRADGPCLYLGYDYSGRLLVVGDEIAPARFVSAAERPGAAGAEVGTWELAAEDGAWKQGGALETASQAHLGCTLDLSGTWRCSRGTMAAFGLSPLWLDATCTGLAVSTWAGLAGCAPTIAAAREVRECRPRSSLFGVGEALPGAFHLDPGTLACTLVEEYLPSWSVGPALDPTSLPPGLDVTLGTGRLRPAAIDFGGASLVTWDFLDSQLGIRCFPGTFESEGVLRCVPAPEYVTTLFSPASFTYADQACTKLLAWANQCAASIADLPQPSSQDTVIHSFFRLGAPHTGAVYVRSGLSDCVPSSGPLPAGIPHPLGEPIPYSAFASFTTERRGR